MIYEYDTTIDMKTAFYYNKMKKYRKCTCIIEEKNPIEAYRIIPLTLKSQSGRKFENKVNES